MENIILYNMAAYCKCSDKVERWLGVTVDNMVTDLNKSNIPLKHVAVFTVNGNYVPLSSIFKENPTTLVEKL